MAVTGDVPDYEEMESLFVNNAKLDRISAYLNQFNPIEIMKVAEKEIRHSNILAWLMDPNETHGFGDGFLKAFLAEALRGHSKKGVPTALDILQGDQLIQAIKDYAKKEGLNDIAFQEGAAEEGRKYSKFFKRNTIEIDDVQNPDKIVDAMKQLLNQFKPCFEAVAKILPHFERYGKKAGD